MQDSAAGIPRKTCAIGHLPWSSRLITYYIKQNQSNTAIYETRKMLAEAEDDDYPEGVASCYRMLGNPT